MKKAHAFAVHELLSGQTSKASVSNDITLLLSAYQAGFSTCG